ncbi:MAG TPA: hypothetical protein VMS17_25370 [Gemmataceae bacterium]|nr:hypothetical protein [Gemmataceae bacterium]
MHERPRRAVALDEGKPRGRRLGVGRRPPTAASSAADADEVLHSSRFGPVCFSVLG